MSDKDDFARAFLNEAGKKEFPFAEISKDLESARRDGAVFVVTLVSEYDPKNNKFWDDNSAKSFPREGCVCRQCKRPVVMSNGSFALWSEDKDPNRILCFHCARKAGPTT